MFLFMLKFFGGLLLLILFGWLAGNVLHLDKFYEKEEDKKTEKIERSKNDKPL